MEVETKSAFEKGGFLCYRECKGRFSVHLKIFEKNRKLVLTICSEYDKVNKLSEEQNLQNIGKCLGCRKSLRAGRTGKSL